MITFERLVIYLDQYGYVVWDKHEGKIQTTMQDYDDVVGCLDQLVGRKVTSRQRNLVARNTAKQAIALGMLQGKLEVVLSSGFLGDFEVLLMTKDSFILKSHKTDNIYLIKERMIKAWELDPPMIFIDRLV